MWDPSTLKKLNERTDALFNPALRKTDTMKGGQNVSLKNGALKPAQKSASRTSLRRTSGRS